MAENGVSDESSDVEHAVAEVRRTVERIIADTPATPDLFRTEIEQFVQENLPELMRSAVSGLLREVAWLVTTQKLSDMTKPTTGTDINVDGDEEWRQQVLAQWNSHPRNIIAEIQYTVRGVIAATPVATDSFRTEIEKFVRDDLPQKIGYTAPETIRQLAWSAITRKLAVMTTITPEMDRDADVEWHQELIAQWNRIVATIT